MSTSTPPQQLDTAAPRPSDPTIGRLVADATENLSGLIRNEIALAKAEISIDAGKAVKGGAMFAVAAVLGLLGLIFLLHTVAIGLATWMPLWAGYLIVTVVLFILAGILAFVGKGAVSKIKGKPARTINSTKSSIDAVKASTSGARTQAVRAVDPISHGPADTTTVGQGRLTARGATTGSTEATVTTTPQA